LRLYLAGTGSIRIAGVCYDWRAGDLVLMEPGDEHQTLAARPGGRMLSLHVWCPRRRRRQAEARVAWLSQRLNNVRHLRLGLGHAAIAALQRAATAVASGALGNDLVAGCAVAEALLLLGREGAAPMDRGALLVAAVQAHIARRYADEPAIEALLAPYDLHPNYLRGLFKQATGMSIRDAWLRARITAAQSLLRAGTLSLTDIAQQVGFADYQAFARRFRAITGMAPGSWRDAVRSG
jgi:AraC-like DNA-binding protein